MMTELNFDQQKVRIAEGELVSYQVNDHEFIHQKGSPGWSSSDTEMFPIIGPVDQANYQVQVPKSSAVQDQHGLLRQFAYTRVSCSSTTAIFRKEYQAGTPIKNNKYPDKSPKQWLVWPYSFSFEKRFLLHQDHLEITFMVNGEKDMPFMLGYHPAFQLKASRPVLKTATQSITLDEVLAVGSRAFEIADCEEIMLHDQKSLKLQTEGFGHMMCWTEVPNMVCVEPITFYPYAVGQDKLHEGFRYLKGQQEFKVKLIPEF